MSEPTTPYPTADPLDPKANPEAPATSGGQDNPTTYDERGFPVPAEGDQPAEHGDTPAETDPAPAHAVTEPPPPADREGTDPLTFQG